MNQVFRLTGNDPTKFEALMQCCYSDVFQTLCYLNDTDKFNKNYAEILRKK